MGVVQDLFNWEKVSWPKRIAIAIPFVACVNEKSGQQHFVSVPAN